ncbi:Lipoyltransferase 1 mitochondrial [Paragonimus skrjabini miyazakii]|uniref:Lipoyltransferase 1 mitochondrial n=1 Tax=Paragonimus skrjabini miyazakii TaxID=59628 RepID=A0A8S9YM51_9TREM|nr:Lipoyltransferase 1 mitochondrial [Paragonimus skrjabini miyazakii]
MCVHSAVSRASSRIFLLQSRDIFRNLAFEACLYLDREGTRQADRTTDLLLWRSNPCVVIGRFQSPWKECCVDLLHENGWSLARRQSGGGAVYHDDNNLNISFMASRQDLDRRKCMEFLQDTLRTLHPTKLFHVGERYDLWLADDENSKPFKISGSSSRLGSNAAYHHCTLLCKSNLSHLSAVLSATFKTLQTKATASVRSPVVNLGVDVEKVQEAVVESSIAWLAHKHVGSPEPLIIRISEGCEQEHVDPARFTRTLNEFQSWSWINGASPAFHLDLSEFEPKLSRFGLFRLDCGRGGVVQSVSLSEQTVEDGRFQGYVHALSTALAGMECRRYAWYGPLDQFCAQWLLQHAEWRNEYELLVNSLRRLSDRL